MEGFADTGQLRPGLMKAPRPLSSYLEMLSGRDSCSSTRCRQRGAVVLGFSLRTELNAERHRCLTGRLRERGLALSDLESRYYVLYSKLFT